MSDVKQQKEVKREAKKFDKKFNNKRNQDNFEEVVIAINRVVKVVKGGRTFRFAAIAVVGDHKGLVGFGTAKSKEVPDAIAKAVENAKRNLIKVKFDNTTVPQDIIGKHDSGRVLLKPAKEGTGIIAGGPVRKVLELAGYKNVVSKSLGSNSPINMIRATFDGLKRMETKESIARLRDIDIKQLS